MILRHKDSSTSSLTNTDRYMRSIPKCFEKIFEKFFFIIEHAKKSSEKIRNMYKSSCYFPLTFDCVLPTSTDEKTPQRDILSHYFVINYIKYTSHLFTEIMIMAMTHLRKLRKLGRTLNNSFHCYAPPQALMLQMKDTVLNKSRFTMPIAAIFMQRTSNATKKML